MSVKPKKHLGQHFLREPRIADRIVDLLQADSAFPVVEIGPGPGVLTERLLPKYPLFYAVEVDPEAIAWLENRFTWQPDRLIQADVLKWEPASVGPAAYIGNLPYNISSPFFFQLLENRSLVREGVFMIQKEVAERICAGPGSKTYGILSVLLGAYFDVKYGFTVPPGVFNPPPKVNSGVIRMVPLAEPSAIPLGTLKHVVKAAFNQRRKTMRNALKGLNFEPFPELESWMDLRAEQLPVTGFLRLAEAVIS